MTHFETLLLDNKQHQVQVKVWNKVTDQVRSRASPQIYDQAGSQVWLQLVDRVWNQVGWRIIAGRDFDENL